MARNHARILTSIWNDDDFLALDSGPQRLYMLLLSQQNLSHAGLLPLTVRRWASKAPDTTPGELEAWLVDLEEARFVVVDRESEELLIRSFIKGDEVYKQPNVMAAAATDAGAMTSPRLRAALLVEVEKLTLVEGLKTGSLRALETLAGTLRRTLPATPTEGLSEKRPEATGMGKGTEVSRFPAPSPTPAPAPVPAAFAADPEDPTGWLVAEHVAAYTQPPPPSAIVPVKREVMRLVAEHVPPDRIRAGLSRLREKRLAASLLPQLVTEATNPSRSTTNDRVAQGLAVVRRYEEAGE